MTVSLAAVVINGFWVKLFDDYIRSVIEFDIYVLKMNCKHYLVLSTSDMFNLFNMFIYDEIGPFENAD